LVYGEHVDRVIGEARTKVEQLLQPTVNAAATEKLRDVLGRIDRQMAHYRDNKNEHLAAGLEVAKQNILSRQKAVGNEKEAANRGNQIEKDVSELEAALTKAKEIEAELKFVRPGWATSTSDRDRDLLKMKFLEETYKGKVGELADYVTIRDRVMEGVRSHVEQTADKALEQIEEQLESLKDLQAKVPSGFFKTVQASLTKQKAHFEELKSTMTEKGWLGGTRHKDIGDLKSDEIRKHVKQVEVDTEKAVTALAEDPHHLANVSEAYEPYRAARESCEKLIDGLLHPSDGSEPQAAFAKELREKLKTIDSFGGVDIDGADLNPLAAAIKQAQGKLEDFRD
jgi:hypothetical protein